MQPATSTLPAGPTAAPSPSTRPFVNFGDFIQFARRYGTRTGDPNYESHFDLDRNGDIGFADFVLLAQQFDRPIGGKWVRLAKQAPGMALAANGNARLVLTSEAGEQPDEVTLTLQVTRAEAVSGYHFQIHYDPDVLTWMGAESLRASRFAGSAGAQLLTL